MPDYFQIHHCEVCGSGELKPVLDLGFHPMCDDLIPVGNAAQCETYPIEILYCGRCDTAHQKHQIPKRRLFPQTYHYRSRFTADVLSGMTALVKSVESRLGSLNGLTVLDIGCNDGSLLDRFQSKNAKTIGVEPTNAYADAEGRGHEIYNDYFSEEVAADILSKHGSIDIVTFTNVFAHIEDLQGLLRAVSMLMSEKTLLIVENHYLGAVLEGNQFDTFYHEHPRTYSLHSFVHIAKSLGREVCDVEFPQRYGGNIRVYIGRPIAAGEEAEARINSVLASESTFLSRFSAMRSFINDWRKEKKAQIASEIELHGVLPAKAFPGRAAILVALLDLSTDQIECVYEKPGSLKIGHYLPGTRIPIRSDDEFFARVGEVPVILNLAWHIPAEISNYLRDNGYKGSIINAV